MFNTLRKPNKLPLPAFMTSASVPTLLAALLAHAFVPDNPTSQAKPANGRDWPLLSRALCVLAAAQ